MSCPAHATAATASLSCSAGVSAGSEVRPTHAPLPSSWQWMEREGETGRGIPSYRKPSIPWPARWRRPASARGWEDHPTSRSSGRGPAEAPGQEWLQEAGPCCSMSTQWLRRACPRPRGPAGRREDRAVWGGGQRASWTAVPERQDLAVLEASLAPSVGRAVLPAQSLLPPPSSCACVPASYEVPVPR